MNSAFYKIKKYLIPIFMAVYSAIVVIWGGVKIFFANHDLFGDSFYPTRLINYRAGFLRRGLGGEIIFKLSSLLNISLVQAIDFFSVLIWIGMIIFFYLKFVQKKYPVFILALPFFLSETILVDSALFLRHDSCILLVFITMIYLISRKSLSLSVSFFLVNLLFVFGILFHEAIFFFSFPILLLTVWHKTDSLMKSFLFFLPALVVFCLCFILPGKSTAMEMLKLTPEIDSKNIVWCFASFSENQADQWAKISETSAFATLLCLFVFVLLVFFVSLNFDKLNFNTKLNALPEKCENCNYLSSVLLLQLISVFPLFFCASDWGRWIFLWIASSFAYFLVVQDDPFDKMPKAFTKLNLFLTKMRSASPESVFLVAIFTGFQFGVPLKFGALCWYSPILISLTAAKKFFCFLLGC